MSEEQTKSESYRPEFQCKGCGRMIHSGTFEGRDNVPLDSGETPHILTCDAVPMSEREKVLKQMGKNPPKLTKQGSLFDQPPAGQAQQAPPVQEKKPEKPAQETPKEEPAKTDPPKKKAPSKKETPPPAEQASPKESAPLAKKTDFVAMDVADWEKTSGIPRGFIVMMGERGKEKPFVQRAGLLVKAEKKGYRSIQVDVSAIKDEATGKTVGWEAKATLFPNLNPADYDLLKHLPSDPALAQKIIDAIVTPITEWGTATKDNVKNSAMWVYLKEMACTRASNRALRAFTACGLTSVEELPEAVIEAEER